MPNATQTIYLSLGGINISGTVRRSASGQISHQLNLAAGKAGTMTGAAEATLGAGHGIITNDVVSVSWAGGAHFRATATVDALKVALAGGAGDALPAGSTAVVLQKMVNIDTDFDGDLLEMIAAVCGKKAVAALYDVDDVLLTHVDLSAEEPWVWASGSGLANPLAGNPVAYVLLGNGSAEATTFSLAALYDSEV